MPTYEAGDKLLIEKLSYRLVSPRRGEVLVIRNPHKHEQTEIKRVVGLPGEKLHFATTSMIVTHSGGNEEVITDPAVVREDTGALDVILGPEDYYVLGDNRPRSTDSRSFGAVQKVDIIGRVILSW